MTAFWMSKAGIVAIIVIGVVVVTCLCVGGMFGLVMVSPAATP